VPNAESSSSEKGKRKGYSGMQTKFLSSLFYQKAPKEKKQEKRAKT